MKKLLSVLGLVCGASWASDPFEDFHEYGDLSEAEIHRLHEGELLYGDTEFGFSVNSGNTNST